jgi:F-type H+-transporting ATPase subunit b
MKLVSRKFLSQLTRWALLVFVAATPLLAAEESSPDATETPVGLVFRWLNFVLVFGALGYLVGKFGGPYFRARAQAIAQAIAAAGETRAQAEREAQQAAEKLASVQTEIEEMRRAAVRDSAAEKERIRALAEREASKIADAARAEIEAAERAGRQELRAIGARLATERAARIVREQMSGAASAALFQAFLGELERSAS